jgi:outer membrane immunogenic protein
VKKLLVAGVLIAATEPTFAADMLGNMMVPYKAPPPAYALTPVYSWTGCYLGIEGGGDWGQSRHVDGNPGTPALFGVPITNSFGTSGGLLGGTAGCNYQFKNIVFSVENDLSWTSNTGSGSDIPPFSTGTTSSTNEKWLDTLRGRVGFAWDRLFLYGTGGAAFADIEAGVCTPAGICVSQSTTRTGWVAGGGIEWAAWTSPLSSVTLKLEYLYTDFGTGGSFFSPPLLVGAETVATRNVSLTDNIVRGGVNWKFNWFDPIWR